MEVIKLNQTNKRPGAETPRRSTVMALFFNFTPLNETRPRNTKNAIKSQCYNLLLAIQAIDCQNFNALLN